MPATTTVVLLLAFGALTAMLVGQPPAMCQSSSQGSSTALNLTIVLPALPFIHPLKYPIATSLPIGEPSALSAGFTPWFCKGVIKDIATRFHKSYVLTNKSLASLAKMFKKIYDDPNCLLTWPTVLIIDKGTEYLGECKDLLLSCGVKIQYVVTKKGVAIAKHDQEFEKHAFYRQDAIDFCLLLTERCRAWVKGLRINDNTFNNTVTRLIHMTSNEAVKRALKGEKIFAELAVKHRRPVRFDEPCLSYKDFSPQVYQIESTLIRKGQSVIYKLEDGPEKKFICEQLQLVKKVKLPPTWVLK
ncbi:22454_t:CDS:2 [Cetraspora pellucida]|uniref:22454_t:CDS:1 n=1 Tax=Cetraspora pellucida TaxID=1433469 RepID=A0A9N8VT70_9GLOM|nr:22454_t:CDS:2 [Cetraspora pellucida]